MSSQKKNNKVITSVMYAILASMAGVSFILPRSLSLETATAAAAGPNVVRLTGVVRGFSSKHTDFDAAQSEAPGHVAGLVDYKLAADGTPVFDGSGNLVTAQARDASGNNIAPVLANAANTKGVNFTINNGRVIPSESFVARLTVLGAAMQNPSYTINVTTRLKIGSTTVDPFGTFTSATAGNVHDNKNPRNYIMSTPMAAGTQLSVIGRSWANSSGWQQLFNVDSNAGATGPGTSGTGGGTTMVKVLRNGDSVPNIKPFGSQSTIQSFLVGYIDANTKKVTIADNQAIFLFELATYDPASEYYDYQDLVTLLTMAKTPDAFLPTPTGLPTCGPTNDVKATTGAATTAGITDASTFHQWFTDSLGKNMSAVAPLDLIQDSSGKYVFDDKTDPRYSKLGGFYPADGRMMGESSASGHNEDFTFMFESYFTYSALTPQFFQVLTDAEVWVFIDDKLVIDMGGFHANLGQRIDLSRLCLTDGKKYKLSFFMANRYAPQSHLRLETNLKFGSDYKPTVLAPID